jgi:hypothetical protein
MSYVEVSVLVPVVLKRARVNRADSGSPQWHDFYFLDPEEARKFYDNELPDNRCGVLEPTSFLHDPNTGKYYKIPEWLTPKIR